MPTVTREQFHWLMGWGVLVAMLLGFSWDGIKALMGPPGHDPSNEAIRESSLPIAGFWAMGVFCLLGARNQLWTEDKKDMLVRVFYTLGCAQCVFHIAVAFHVGHGWSHQAAYDHTEQASGFGPGVFVNYLFVAVWVVDVVWTWVALHSYLKRPLRLNWTVLGFMWFILFNAGVIFGSGWWRWVNLADLLIPWPFLWAEWRRKCQPEPPEEKP